MEPPPPFQLSEPVGDGPETRPVIEVVLPPQGEPVEVEARRNFPCQVRLSYTGGGRLPVFLVAYIKDSKGRDCGSAPFEPMSKEGRTYTLGAMIKAPRPPGTYRLVVDAVFLDFEATAKLPPTQPPVDYHVLTEAGTLKVRNR